MSPRKASAKTGGGPRKQTVAQPVNAPLTEQTLQPPIETPRSFRAAKLAIKKAIQELAEEGTVVSLLVDHMNDITGLRSHGLTDERIAEHLAQALETSPESILAFLHSHRAPAPASATTPTSTPVSLLPRSYETSDLTPPPKTGRVRISSTDIRAAIQSVMTEKKLKVFRMSDEDAVSEILERVPALKTLPTHERNRRIIDSCIHRKHGPVIRTRDGQREIVLAA
jgi:hypothetical protein